MASFWRRPQAVAFWAMFMLNLPFGLLASSSSPSNGMLFVVLMLCELTVHGFLRLLYLGELKVKIERIEKICFWSAMVSALAILTVEFLAVSYVDLFVVLLMALGLAIYGLVYLLSLRQPETSW